MRDAHLRQISPHDDMVARLIVGAGSGRLRPRSPACWPKMNEGRACARTTNFILASETGRSYLPRCRAGAGQQTLRGRQTKPALRRGGLQCSFAPAVRLPIWCPPMSRGDPHFGFGGFRRTAGGAACAKGAGGDPVHLRVGEREGLCAIRAVCDGQARCAGRAIARAQLSRAAFVAHFVIDGGISSDRRPPQADKPDALLAPDAIAETYLHVLRQPKSAWTSEIELRPWVENF